MSLPSFAVDDRVVCDPNQTPPRLHNIVYVVVRLLRVNVELDRVGGGPGLRIHPSALLSEPVAGTTDASIIPLQPTPLTLGTVVTVAGPRWTGGTGLHVVLADHGHQVKLVRLGGNNHSYWPKVPRAWITEVDRDALLTTVAGLTGTGR